jgi:hypothetical protein
LLFGREKSDRATAPIAAHLRRTAIVVGLEFGNARKVAYDVVIIFDRQTELNSFQCDIVRADGNEVDHVTVFLVCFYRAGRDF